MKPTSPWLARLRYTFDTTLSQGPLALVGWLGLASAALVLLTSLIVWGIAGSEQLSLPVIVWDILFQALTPNPVAPDGPAAFLLAMLIVTLGSLFMVSILIGILTTGMEDRIHSLRKGRSHVLESGHTVLLGWDEHIFSILAELTLANANQPKARACIVVLGNKDKVEMEDEIRERLGPPGHTRIVCRSGDPINPRDLEIVSVNTARAIIVLAPDDDDPDASVIKTLLSILNNPHRRPEPYHIVAELHNAANLEAARSISEAEVELVLIKHLMSHIIAQTCRRSGLSTVYTELLNFEGNEIYFQEEPALVGKTFGEALLAYEDSVVIGVWPREGQPKLNPPMEAQLQAGDQLIAISEDDDTVQLSGLKTWGINEAALRLGKPAPAQPERTLCLGWNSQAPVILRELEPYLAPGSATRVVTEDPALAASQAELCATLKNQTVEFTVCNTTAWQALEQLRVETYQHVVVLAYSDTLPPQKADARTLMTLLHLRAIAKRAAQTFTIVSEMLDERNRELAEVTHADDFIVSGKLASLLLAQIAENKELRAVFEDLFDAEGAEIYLKPTANYVQPNEPLNFYTVVEAARRQNEIALGYRLHAQANDAAQRYGVVLNPAKSRRVTLTEHDRVIVLSEAE